MTKQSTPYKVHHETYRSAKAADARQAELLELGATLVSWVVGGVYHIKWHW